MWNNLGNREKILLSVLGAGGTIFLFIWFIFLPQVKAYAETRNQLRDNQAKLAAAEALAASFPREKESLILAEEKLKQFDVYFRNNVKSGASIMEVGFKAQKSGVEIKQFKTAGVVNKQYYLELPFKYTIEGQYPDAVLFVKEMENLSNLSEVRYIEIKPADAEPGNQQGEGKGTSKSQSPVVSTGRVRADFEIVLYSDTSPESRLMLEEISRWAVGRFNAFSTAAPVSPFRGVRVSSSRISEKGAGPAAGKVLNMPGTAVESVSGGDDEQKSITNYVYVPLVSK